MELLELNDFLEELQRSQTRKDIDLLGSQRTLAKEYFNWNF